MVRFIYNVGQNLLILLFWPVILLFVTAKAKYRFRFWARCGFGLRGKCGSRTEAGQRFWIHALSVGELSSVVSLVKALRKAYPDATLLLSTTSTAGDLYARKRLSASVDAFIAFPYDHIFIVRYFLALIRPQLFIQVETDFWPNVLAGVSRLGVPSFLVNGRVSEAAFRRYRNYPSLFLPLFNSFSCLGMQTVADVKRMEELGVPGKKIRMPGNLKIDAAMPGVYDHTGEIESPFSSGRLLVLGSTHPGEEEELAPALYAIKTTCPDARFVLAPRDIGRGQEVVNILARHGLHASLRSKGLIVDPNVDCLVLDSMGELVHYYQLAEIAFVGGSLKPFGGHNPLEPVAFGTPVFFGSHMEDFADICEEMLAKECAVQVDDAAMFATQACALLKNSDRRKELGQAGLDYIIKRQGVTERHLRLIEQLLHGQFE